MPDLQKKQETQEAGTEGKNTQAGTFHFGEWLKNPDNEAMARDWAEKDVAAPIKKKADEILNEKKQLQQKYEKAMAELKRFQSGTDDGDGDGQENSDPPPKDKRTPAVKKPASKFSDEELAKALQSRDQEWEAKLSTEQAEKAKLLKKYEASMIRDEVKRNLLEAGMVSDDLDVFLSHITASYENGNPKFSLEEKDGTMRVFVLEENGKPKIGKKGSMGIDEYVASLPQKHKNFFRAPRSGGSGSTSSNQAGGIGGFKISFESWERLPSAKQREYVPSDIAPPAKG